MNEWKNIELSEIADFQTGKLDSNASEENGVYPFFTCSPTTLRINTYKFDTEAVLLAGNNANGVFSVKYFKGRFNAYQRTYVITPKKEDISIKWLYYQISHVTERFQSLAIGTATKFLTMTILNSFRCNLPPLPEQKAIAHILMKLDDKIELNRQMNQTLEAMAQALFKSWFVDFDPVLDNALEAGHEIPDSLQAMAEKRQFVPDSTKLLHKNPALAAQFPSSFVFNETLDKWIPEGWEVKKLGEISIEIRRGISPKYIEEGGIRILNQKCIRNHEVDYKLARRNDPTMKKVDGRFLEINDMVVNSTGTGTLGRVANIISLDEPTVVDSHVTVLRADENLILKNFFNGLIFSIESIIEAMGEGSTGQTELSRARLAEFEVLVPAKEVQRSIDKILKKIYLKKDSNSYETETLTQLRDTLLPELISGRVRVVELALNTESKFSE